MASNQSDTEFIGQLRSVLHFLQDHGFTKAADAIYEQLEDKEQRSDTPGEGGSELEDEGEPTSPGSAPGYGDHERDSVGSGGQRSRSAEPVLTSQGGLTEDEEAEEGEDEAIDPEEYRQRKQEEVLALTRRHSGSQRHHEDPERDEYDGIDDVGYIRRVISRQQEFILTQLESERELERESEHGSPSPGETSSQKGSGAKYKRSVGGEPGGYAEGERAGSVGSSASSSASLGGGISPGVSAGGADDSTSSGKQRQQGATSGSGGSLRNDSMRQQDQKQQQHAKGWGKESSGGGEVSSVPTGDEAWDQGPTDITFAEPVSTPNRGSRRSSASEAKPSLSRVESLSNSFIDETESVTDCGRLSEAGSLGPAEVIDFAPVLPPDAPEADFGPVFDLKAQRALASGGSVTSSLDVMRGSVQGASEAGSERGSEAGALRSGGGAPSVMLVLGKVLAPAPAVVAVAEEPSTPTTADAGGREGEDNGVGGFGAGFSFPVTPPTDDEEHGAEARAERVFSTWASSHSRQSDDEGLAEGAAGSPSSSHKRKLSRTSTGADEANAQDVTPFGWPAMLQSKGSSRAGGEAVQQGQPLRHKSLDAPKAAAAGSRRGGAPAAQSDPGDTHNRPSKSPSQNGLNQQQQQQQQQQQHASPSARPGTPPSDDGTFHTAAGGSEASSSRGAASADGSAAAGPGSAKEAGRGKARKGSKAGAQQQEQQQEEEQQEGEEGTDEGHVHDDYEGASIDSAGQRSGGETPVPRYVVDEHGNVIYEYDPAYVEARYEVFDLRIVHRRHRTGFEESKDFPIRKNDLIAGRYQVMDFLGSAAFSQAVQALDVATGGLVCLKIIKNNKDYFDQSLDEIKLLRYVNMCDPADEHHIVRLYDFFYYKEHLFLVCELLRANLYEFQKYQRDNGDPPYFTLPRIQAIARQVLHSLAFLHSLGLIHSDLKPENILIKSYSRCEVKVIDLGSSCFTSDHLSSYVQSRSYRAPEVILGLRYDHKIDIWSLGCILAELSSGYVLFQNDSLSTLLARLEGILGPLPGWMVAEGRYSHRYYTKSCQVYERSPHNNRYEILQPKHTSLRHRVPDADEAFLDFMSYLLTLDPTLRPTAEEALQHPWLRFPYPPLEPMQD